MENHEVDALGRALRHAFERSPELQPRPEFIANLARLRPAPAPASHRRTITRWLAVAATVAMATIGGYWAFEARLIADPLRDAAIGDHRYCALGLTTDGKEATGITSLAQAAARYEPAYHLFESLPGDQVQTSAGQARVLDRHSCVFGGRRFAHVILQYRGAPVSLIVTHGRASSASAAAAHAPSSSQSNGLTVISFGTGDYSVFVVGALTAADLSPLADAISGDIVHALAKI